MNDTQPPVSADTSEGAGPSDPTPPAVGDDLLDLEQPFPGYVVGDKIAQGGMAAVFRARDIRLDRDVAVKVLIPDLAANEDAVEHFFGEARNVARLRHPNLVRGLDVGRTGKYFYFVMEYVRGESLAQKLERLERSRVPEAESIRIVRDVARALQYVFEEGLVHRDVKPGNILLVSGSGAKLCDLGVARDVAFPAPESVLKGSPSYAAPEQARGDLDVDIRADLYGLGCTWFHMLLGHPPFRGASADDILRQHLEADPPPPREVDPRVSAATSQLILWLLAKDRDDRPRTPQDFLVRLADHPLAPEETDETPAPADPLLAEADAAGGDVLADDEAES